MERSRKLKIMLKRLRAYLISGDLIGNYKDDLFSKSKNRLIWKAKMEVLKSWSVQDTLVSRDAFEKMVRTDADYRMSMMVMAKESVAVVMSDLMALSGVMLKCCVSISVMVNKMGSEPVRCFLIELVMGLVGDRVKANEVIVIVNVMMNGLAEVSVEEFILAVSNGMAGSYGDVYKSIKSNDVLYWVRSYRSIRNKDCVRFDQKWNDVKIGLVKYGGGGLFANEEEE